MPPAAPQRPSRRGGPLSCPDPGRRPVKHTKSKTAGGLVTRTIVYRDRSRPHSRDQHLKVDVRRDEVIDLDYAAAMVAVRTGLPLAYVRVIRITP